MFRRRLKAVSTVFICLALALLLDGGRRADARQIPHPFAVAARAAVLMDANSGQFLYGQNPHERIRPASFVKLMTLFLVFDAVAQGQAGLEDKVWISKKAWSTGGSRMFLRQGSEVPLEQLIKGIAVVSGNDACVAVAEYLQGSEAAFVEKMNQKLRQLGLKDSRFQTVNGWPAQKQYTSAFDMALLARAYIRLHPEALQYHHLKEFTYDNVRQRNRNGLLWQDPSVDGLKTGHTEQAGYHLLATAKRGDQRFIAVVMGAKSEAIREREALRLLNYGFRNFVSVSLFQKGQRLLRLPVWKGTAGRVGLGASEPGVVTVAIAQRDRVTWRAKVPERLFAPIHRGQPCGQAVILLENRPIKAVALVALREIGRAGFFKRCLHSLVLFGLTQNKRLLLLLFLLAGMAGVLWYVKHNRRQRQRRQ